MVVMQHARVTSAFDSTPAFFARPEQALSASGRALPIALLGVPFDPVTMAEAIERIERMIGSGRPHYVVTANADFLAQARQDVELRRILMEAHLVLCDGTPLLWASRLLGNPLPERVAGSDLAPRLIRLAAKRNYRLFLLGASPEANAQAAARLKEHCPGLNLVGNYSPPFQPLLEMDHAEIQKRIRAARPDLLFVSFGCPKQEKWIAMHYQALGVPVTVGMGATIDFLAGRMKRAPRWMQRAGLEWVFRLLQEPRRLFKRYLGDFRHFGGAILRQCWQMQWRPCRVPQARSSSLVVVEPTWQRVRVSERLDVESVTRDAAVWQQVVAHDRHALLDLTDTQFIDSTGAALLVRLRHQLRRAGHHLILVDPSVPVRRTLQWLRLHDYFETAADAVEAREIIAGRDQEQSALVAADGATRSLAWRGEVTVANAGEVWRLTEAQIAGLSARQKIISLDLSEVRFVDSTGLGVMVRAKKFAARRGNQLLFTGLRSDVRNVLRLSKLAAFLLDKAA